MLPYAAGGQAVVENVELRHPLPKLPVGGLGTIFGPVVGAFFVVLPLLVREPNRPAYRFATRSGPGSRSRSRAVPVRGGLASITPDRFATPDLTGG